MHFYLLVAFSLAQDVAVQLSNMAKRPAAAPEDAENVDATPKSKARRGSKRVVDNEAEDAEADAEADEDAAAPKKKQKKPSTAAAVSRASSAQVPDAPPGSGLTADSLQKMAVAQALKVLHDTTPENADEAFKQMSSSTRQALWKRFEHARVADISGKVTEQWNDVSVKGCRGSDAKKRFLLIAYLQNGFNDRYFKMTATITVGNKHKRGLDWSTWKQVVDHFGEEEAKSRVRAGTLTSRQDPIDSRYQQYLIVTEGSAVETGQSVIVDVTQGKKVTSKEAKLLQRSVLAEQEPSFATELLSGNFKSLGGDKKLQELIDELDVSDDEPAKNEASGSKSAAGQAIKEAKKAEKQGKYLEKLDAVSTIVAGDSLGAALRKCSQMRSYTTKSLQLLTLHLQAHPKEKGNFKKLHKQLQEIHAGLDSHIINCTGTTEEIKDILLECAAVVKAVNDLQNEE